MQAITCDRIAVGLTINRASYRGPFLLSDSGTRLPAASSRVTLLGQSWDWLSPMSFEMAEGICTPIVPAILACTPEKLQAPLPSLAIVATRRLTQPGSLMHRQPPDLLSESTSQRRGPLEYPAPSTICSTAPSTTAYHSTSPDAQREQTGRVWRLSTLDKTTRAMPSTATKCLACRPGCVLQPISKDWAVCCVHSALSTDGWTLDLGLCPECHV